MSIVPLLEDPGRFADAPGDRGLDRAIADEVIDDCARIAKHCADDDEPLIWHDHRWHKTSIPAFTTDINAAAELVPAGFWWRLLRAQDGRYHPEVGRQARDDETAEYANGCVLFDDAHGYSFASGALALSITALRIRAKITSHEGAGT